MKSQRSPKRPSTSSSLASSREQVFLYWLLSCKIWLCKILFPVGNFLGSRSRQLSALSQCVRGQTVENQWTTGEGAFLHRLKPDDRAEAETSCARMATASLFQPNDIWKGAPRNVCYSQLFYWLGLSLQWYWQSWGCVTPIDNVITLQATVLKAPVHRSLVLIVPFQKNIDISGEKKINKNPTGMLDHCLNRIIQF